MICEIVGCQLPVTCNHYCNAHHEAVCCRGVSPKAIARVISAEADAESSAHTPPPDILTTFRDLQIASEVRFDAVIRIRGTRRTWSARIQSSDKVTGWPSILEEVEGAGTPGEALLGALVRFDAAWNAGRDRAPATCPRCAAAAGGGLVSAVLDGNCLACRWHYVPPPRVPTVIP